MSLTHFPDSELCIPLHQPSQIAPIQNPIIRWLVYSHVWMALCAAAQVWWTFMYVGDRKAEHALIAFAFFGTISAYGFMRLMRAKGQLTVLVPLFNWVDRNRVTQWILVVITGVLAFICILPFVSQLIGILWWVVPICILYVIPFGYPKRYFGLRAIPVLKVPLIGLVWAVVTVVLPMSTNDATFKDPIWLLIVIQRLLLVMALTIAFDIRDAQHDPPGLRTIPQMLGDRGARLVALAMLIIGIVIQITLIEFVPVPLPLLFHLLPLIGFVMASWLIIIADRSKPEIFFGFTMDGVLFLIPLLAWLGRMLF